MWEFDTDMQLFLPKSVQTLVETFSNIYINIQLRHLLFFLNKLHRHFYVESVFYSLFYIFTLQISNKLLLLKFFWYYYVTFRNRFQISINKIKFSRYILNCRPSEIYILFHRLLRKSYW